MMSYEQIRGEARSAQRRAKKLHREPQTFVGLGEDAIRESIRSIPFLGKNERDNPYVPKGWKRVDAPNPPRYMGCTAGYLFVDASGFGGEHEPALTVGQFVDYIYAHRELGYAIVESGQFQVVIATYERNHKNGERRNQSEES